jgi:hypothetical protein
VQDASIAPAVEQGRCSLVAIARVSGVVRGKLKPDDVVRAASLQSNPLWFGDHVVRGTHDVVERSHVRAGVAKAGEGFESGHGPTA